MDMVVTAVGTLSGFFIIEVTFKIWINVIFILVQKQDFLGKISYDKGFSSCFDRHLSRLAVQIAFVQILIIGAFLARTGCKHVFQINIHLSQLLDLYFFHEILGCKTRKYRCALRCTLKNWKLAIHLFTDAICTIKVEKAVNFEQT